MKPPVKNKMVYVLTGLFFLGCIAATLNLELDERVTAMLPESDPMAKDFKFIINHVPATETVYIDIELLEGDKALLKQAADEFYDRIKTAPFFDEIVYQFSYEAYTGLVSLVRENRPLLLTPGDTDRLASLLTEDRIHSRVGEIKRRLLEPSGLFLADKLTRDPLDIDAIILSKLDAFKNETHRVKMDGNRIFSSDMMHLLIMATPSFPAVDTDESLSMMTYLDRERNRISAKFDHKIRIGISGTHVATLDNSRTIRGDVKRTVTVLSLGILSVGFLFFRKKIHVLLVFLPTLVSMSFAAAVLSFFYKDISAIAVGCGAVLIGITVDFGIHILFGVDAGQDGSAGAVIKKLKRPVFAGACTTMATFSCLLFSSLPGQRQMGAFAVIGIAGAAIFAIFLLRYFIPENTGDRSRPLVNLVYFCDRLTAFRKQNFWKIFLTGIALLILGAWGMQDFRFDGDVTGLNHLQPETQDDLDRFLDTWGGISPSLVLVKSDTLDSALEKNDELYDLLKHLQKRGDISRVATLAEIFPSQKIKEKNRQYFKKIMTPQKIQKVRKMFETAAVDHGFKPETFHPFIDSLTRAETGITQKDFNNTVLKPLISSKIIFVKDSVFILTSMHVADKTRIPWVVDQIKSVFPDASILDKKYFIRTVTQVVETEFRHLFLFAAAAMMGVVTIFFRNIKIAVIIISPVFTAAFITAGILGLLDIPINLISMIFIIFVFGVGIDFSIFLANHELQKDGDTGNITAGSVMICAMTTVGAFACLIFARHDALFSIGAAGLTGMVSSLILSLLMIPFLIEKVTGAEDRRRFHG